MEKQTRRYFLKKLGFADLPKDRDIDGVNLPGYLTGNNKRTPHEVLFWCKRQDYAVRKGNFKLVRAGSSRELFDLFSDIGESRNLSKERPELLMELEQAHDRWNSQMIEPVWTRLPRTRKTTRKNKKT